VEASVTIVSVTDPTDSVRLPVSLYTEHEAIVRTPQEATWGFSYDTIIGLYTDGTICATHKWQDLTVSDGYIIVTGLDGLWVLIVTTEEAAKRRLVVDT
jgi:hypothetical protein